MKRLITSSMAFVAAISLFTTAGAFAQTLDPFTFRAPLDPYQIDQLPDFTIQSRVRSDFVVQRSVFAPGAGVWHIHPGPSFVYVIEGQIRVQKFTAQGGCVETLLFGPGQAYFEIGNEVHRAIVVSQQSAVLLVARFNIPVGGAITIPAADPGCILPSGLIAPGATPLDQPPHMAHAVAEATPQPLEPFLFRATLDPYQIDQPPDFTIQSRARSDFIIQRGVFAPGVGGWHTHPGPSFAYVVQGQVKLQKFTEKGGCVETSVYGPGQVYLKPANEVHRAIVVSAENAVEMIVRFNYPVGAPIGIPAADPGCNLGSTIHSAVEVCWSTENNKRYQIQWRSALDTNSWSNFGSPIAGDGLTKCVFDSTQGRDKRFYQVVTLP